jgi:hypothetical protein
MESYSHTTVPSRMSTRLLSDTSACIPEDKVCNAYGELIHPGKLLVQHDFACLLRVLPLGKKMIPDLQLLSSSIAPQRKYSVKDCGPYRGLDCEASYDDLAV